MLKIKHNILSASLLSLVLVSFSAVADKPVAISKGDGPNSLEIGVSVTVGEHKIMRNQDNSATVNPAFAKTSRPCPPFCIQPMQLRPGIETLGEQEIIHYRPHLVAKAGKWPDPHKRYDAKNTGKQHGHCDVQAQCHEAQHEAKSNCNLSDVNHCQLSRPRVSIRDLASFNSR